MSGGSCRLCGSSEPLHPIGEVSDFFFQIRGGFCTTLRRNVYKEMSRVGGVAADSLPERSGIDSLHESPTRREGGEHMHADRLDNTVPRSDDLQKTKLEYCYRENYLGPGNGFDIGFSSKFMQGGKV